MKNIISLQNIAVSFDGERILNNINLDIGDKEFVTLLGPSGCGKTTTLRIIGGFLTPDSGSVMFDGKEINNLPPYKRNVNTVFQKYALFPHLNVYDNIAFGLRVKKLDDGEIKRRVAQMLELVNLIGFEKRSISRLSGGQQQRVAVARAIAAAPPVILADEPTGNLDTHSTKDVMQILHNLKDEGRTVVVITHDNEIAEQAERVIRIRDGRVVEDYINPGFEEKYGRESKKDNKNPIDQG